MKKNLLFALLISGMFSSLAIAEGQVDCDQQLSVCLEKCTGKNAEACEEACEEKLEICLEQEEKKQEAK
ncbi:MAG: hypothetical protein H8E76_08690 [Helicobacteraceae bacterium]|nr:hypothetical protein [Candidatus Sulfurimonas ponti]MBL6973955.1 hypothetical protein [Sulfurimonas sp.]